MGLLLPTTRRRAGPAAFHGAASYHSTSTSLTPFSPKFEDVLVDFVGSVGGGRAGIYPNPNYDWTESFLSVGDEAGGVIGVASLQTSHQVANLGTDSAPDAVEQSVVDSTKRLGRLGGVSASRLDPGLFG